MKKSGILRLSLIFVVFATIFICASSISFAATSVKKVNYKGGGKVDVTFAEKTSYSKSASVDVKDNNGNSYSTSITSKKATVISFRIYKYKTGRTYKVTIKGLKNGNAVTSFKIISKSKAISIAKKRAKSSWKAKSFSNVSASSSTYKGTAVWKVTFDSGDFHYTYWVSQQSGSILRSSRSQK